LTELKTKDMKEKLQDTATIAQTCETKQRLQDEAAVKKIEREFGKRHVTIMVRHGMNTYIGKRKLKEDEELRELKAIMAACAANKAASFRLETEDGFVYFPNQILKKCVFSLVVEN
jgi:hypothetical protein